MDDEVAELITCCVKECYVYVPIPPPMSYGHRAELWGDLDKCWYKASRGERAPGASSSNAFSLAAWRTAGVVKQALLPNGLQMVTMRMVQRGDDALVRLTLQDTGVCAERGCPRHPFQERKGPPALPGACKPAQVHTRSWPRAEHIVSSQLGGRLKTRCSMHSIRPLTVAQGAMHSACTNAHAVDAGELFAECPLPADGTPLTAVRTRACMPCDMAALPLSLAQRV